MPECQAVKPSRPKLGLRMARIGSNVGTVRISLRLRGNILTGRN